MRQPNDFYETPPWQTEALLERIHLPGNIIECCNGDGSISNVLTPRLVNGNLLTNDIDTNRISNFHLDATLETSWQAMCRGFIPSWAVTNPPYNSAYDILTSAMPFVNRGVVMLLRLSFLEPTKARSEWLFRNPPWRLIVLPRWSYTRNGHSDSVTTAWMIWSKEHRGEGRIEVVPVTKKPPAGKAKSLPARGRPLIEVLNQPRFRQEPVFV